MYQICCLSKHMEYNHGDIVYHCEYCKKYFRIFSLYENHVWSFHSRSPQQEVMMKSSSNRKNKVQVKNIQPKIIIDKHKQKIGCEDCGKLFSSISYIEKHKKEVHSKQKDYNCSECKMSFSRKWSLSCHIRIHKGELPYKCKYCNLKFRTASAKNQHKIEKHETDRKPKPVHKCLYCSFTSKSKKYIENIHKRSHTGEKPYQCPSCELKFGRKFVLKHHSKTAHGYSKQDMMDAGMYSQMTVLKESKNLQV